MSNDNKNLEQELRDKETQSGLFDDSIADENTPKSLGNVKKDKQRQKAQEKAAPDPMGWNPMAISNLPSKGKFYPEGTILEVKAAKTSEIRHYSTLDETNLFDVDEKLNYIVQNCSRLSGTTQLTWKDILEEDRIFVLLAIRDLTFAEPENALQVSKKCGDCGFENIIPINKDNFVYQEVPENIEKYYSEADRSYMVTTKSAGTISIKPPSIGVMQIITKYIRDKETNEQAWDKSWIQIAPYYFGDWRGLNAKKIFEGEVDSKGWNMNQFMVRQQLAEKVKVGVTTDLSVACESCGSEVTTPVRFPGGVKGLFIISDLAGELL